MYKPTYEFYYQSREIHFGIFSRRNLTFSREFKITVKISDQVKHTTFVHNSQRAIENRSRTWSHVIKI